MKNISAKLTAVFLLSSLLATSGGFETVQALSPIIFPVIGPVSYHDDFSDPRSGHLHEGNDLMGKKMQTLISPVDGEVVSMELPEATWGYSVTLRDSEGYTYHYLHINNDTPGTDDHKGGPMFAYAPDISVGRKVVKGQLIGWMGDSGNAESTGPHLHFEIRQPDRTPISPFVSLQSAVKIPSPVVAPAASDETLPYGGDILSVSIAVGNFDTDSEMEFVTGAGKGGGPHVRIMNKVGSPESLGSFYAYIPGFLGGVDVAAGDVDGDGIDEIITGAGPGGGPHVKIFKVNGTEFNAGFFAYDPKFKGGVNVTAADLDGDGKAEIITGPGPGGGPHVKIFKADGTQVNGGFFAYDSKFSGGVDVGAAPAGGGQSSFIITGPGPGGGPHVKIFNIQGDLQKEFFAYDPAFAGGLRVAGGNARTSTAQYEVAVAPASNHEPEFKLYSRDGEELQTTKRTFDEWWLGSYDIAAGKGIALGSAGGKGATGPVGRRASTREINFGTQSNFNDFRWRRSSFQ